MRDVERVQSDRDAATGHDDHFVAHPFEVRHRLDNQRHGGQLGLFRALVHERRAAQLENNGVRFRHCLCGGGAAAAVLAGVKVQIEIEIEIEINIFIWTMHNTQYGARICMYIYIYIYIY